MNNFAKIAAAAALLTIASLGSALALTPEGERCVTKYGYSLSQWTAYSVPEGPTKKIRACHASLRAARAARGERIQ